MNDKFLYNEWLTEQLEKPSYTLKCTPSDLSVGDIPMEECFVEAKVAVSDQLGLHHLQSLGFSTIVSQVCLKKKVANHSVEYDASPVIRLATPSDECPVRKIAASSFLENRFNRDMMIDPSVASKMKETWASNFFAKTRGDFMIVAEHRGSVVGFLLLIMRNRCDIVIDLIAVDALSRGNGLAKNMIEFAENKILHGGGTIEVGTQLSNIPSLNLYTKNGFNIFKAWHSLHLHQKV